MVSGLYLCLTLVVIGRAQDTAELVQTTFANLWFANYEYHYDYDEVFDGKDGSLLRDFNAYDYDYDYDEVFDGTGGSLWHDFNSEYDSKYEREYDINHLCITESAKNLEDMSLDLEQRANDKYPDHTGPEYWRMQKDSLALDSCSLDKNVNNLTHLSYSSKGVTYHANTCQLLRMTPAQADTCIRGKRIFWVGDSIDSVFYHTFARTLGIGSQRNKTHEQTVRGCAHAKDCNKAKFARRSNNLSQMISDTKELPGGGTLSLIPFISCETDLLRTVYSEGQPDVLILSMYQWDNSEMCIKDLSMVVSDQHKDMRRKPTQTIWRGPTCGTPEAVDEAYKNLFDGTAKDLMHSAGASIADAYDLTCSTHRPANFDWMTLDGTHFAVGSPIPATLAQLMLSIICPSQSVPPSIGQWCHGDRITGFWS